MYPYAEAELVFCRWRTTVKSQKCDTASYIFSKNRNVVANRQSIAQTWSRLSSFLLGLQLHNQKTQSEMWMRFRDTLGPMHRLDELTSSGTVESVSGFSKALSRMEILNIPRSLYNGPHPPTVNSPSASNHPTSLRLHHYPHFQSFRLRFKPRSPDRHTSAQNAIPIHHCRPFPRHRGHCLPNCSRAHYTRPGRPGAMQ